MGKIRAFSGILSNREGIGMVFAPFFAEPKKANTPGGEATATEARRD